MLPAAITVLILLVALGLIFGWLHTRIAKLEEESTEHSQWRIEQERKRKQERPA